MPLVINVNYLIERFSLEFNSEVGAMIFNMELFDFFVAYSQERQTLTLSMADLVVEDKTLFNSSPNKLVLHVGECTASDVLFYNLSKIKKPDNHDKIIEESFMMQRRRMHKYPKLDQSFFRRSLLNIKDRLDAAWQPREKVPSFLDLNRLTNQACLINMRLSNNEMDVTIKKVMLMWNTIFFQFVITYIKDAQDVLMKNLPINIGKKRPEEYDKTTVSDQDVNKILT